MKFLRIGDQGRERPALLDDDGVLRDLSAFVADIDPVTIGNGALAGLVDLAPSALPAIDPGVRIAPCVGRVGKFIGVGLNYADHASEMNLASADPVFFLKANSSIAGPNDAVELPRGSQHTDWEVELGIVIGRRGRYIDANNALDHVFGYCVVNDITERRYQLDHPIPQWSRGKSCDGFGPIGPWLVTRDEVPDYGALELWLEVNGERHQHCRANRMVRGIAELIAHLSNFMTLEPGDVIATGSPAGAGQALQPEPRFLKPGDTMVLGITGLGEQRQEVLAAS